LFARCTSLVAQGFFAEFAGTSGCTACHAGTFGANASQTTCTPCFLPEYTDHAAARQCSSCNAGFYAVFRNASAGVFSECRLCPSGADCPALRNMTISPRYYAVRDAATLAVQTFLCDGSRCAVDGACGPNRVPAEDNPLCGQCLSGYSEWDGACIACPGTNGGLVFGLLLLAWACTLAIHALSQSDSGSGALRVTMFFWQVAFLVLGSAAWVNWANFLDLNFIASGGAGGSSGLCPFPVSPHGMLVLRLLGPLLMFALLAVTAAAHFAVDAWRRRLPEGSAATASAPCPRLQLMLDFEAAQYWRSAIALYFFTFNQVTRQCLSFFDCVTLPSGRYVVALPAVRCDEAGYRTLLPLAVVLLAGYAVVVPTVMVYKVHVHRGGAQERRDSVRPDRVWSVVYSPFHAGVQWWGLGQTLLRAALVATTVFLRDDRDARLGIVTLLNGAAALLLALLKPNRRASDNAWELASLAVLQLLALSAIAGVPAAWLAVVTLGTGLAIAARLGAQGLRRLATTRDASAAAVNGASAADDGEDGADGGEDGSRVGVRLRTASVGQGYVQLGGDS
jgi:hypothetical protein